MTGIELIATERERQVSVEGYGDEHDNDHEDGTLAEAGAHLAALRGYDHAPAWSKHLKVKHSRNRVRELTIAGALVAAEIDRIQRRDSSI
jgi:hypothetical protein